MNRLKQYGYLVPVLILSLVLIYSAGVVFHTYRDRAEMMAGVGQLLGALATAISVIWLAFSHHMQRVSTEMQMAELALQRQAAITTADSLAAQLFVQFVVQTQQALARYARSCVLLVRDQLGVAGDAGRSTQPDLHGYVDQLLNDPTLRGYVDAALPERDPLIWSIMNSYCDKYELVRAQSPNAQADNLFAVVMADSAYHQLYKLFAGRLERHVPAGAASEHQIGHA